MAADLLQGEILEQYRNVVAVTAEKKEKDDPDKTAANPCSEILLCSQAGCTGATTDETKKKKKAQAAGWFDPPVA